MEMIQKHLNKPSSVYLLEAVNNYK